MASPPEEGVGSDARSTRMHQGQRGVGGGLSAANKEAPRRPGEDHGAAEGVPVEAGVGEARVQGCLLVASAG